MDFRGFVEVTEVDSRLLVQVAYSGSAPQGLGYLHAKPGGLDEATLDEIMRRSEREPPVGEIYLDYLHGRSMKFSIRIDHETGKKYVDLDWYDHGREALKRLVRECRTPDVEARIAAAEEGKIAKEKEWERTKQAGARLFLAQLADMGGEAHADKPPFDRYYELPSSSPISCGWSFRDIAEKNGWVRTQNFRDYYITDAGREAAAVLAAHNEAEAAYLSIFPAPVGFEPP